MSWLVAGGQRQLLVARSGLAAGVRKVAGCIVNVWSTLIAAIACFLGWVGWLSKLVRFHTSSTRPRVIQSPSTSRRAEHMRAAAKVLRSHLPHFPFRGFFGIAGNPTVFLNHIGFQAKTQRGDAGSWGVNSLMRWGTS